MRGFLLRNLFLQSRNTNFSHILKPINTPIISYLNRNSNNLFTEKATFLRLFHSQTRFFSSGNGSNDSDTSTESEAVVVPTNVKNDVLDIVEDVKNKDLKVHVEDYLNNMNEDALPDVFESILRRKLSGKHEDTDDELLEELQIKPLEKVDDVEFESDFDDIVETDEEIEDLYDTRKIVINKMTAGDGGKQSICMNEMKWDDMIKEAVGHGFLKDTRECEDLLEDMLQWDKLLPDEIKKKVEKKFNEIGDRVEKGELEVEEGYALFKEFEDKMVVECTKLMKAEKPSHLNKGALTKDKKESDDPPGEGPILRWQTRVVLSPGGDAWHPKNRKVKLAVTVKELGFSRHQFLRFRELVGKRYNPGRDELTITSERFEHREENRKDCLRTLFNLIEEAGKAKKLVKEARIIDVKNRLIANPLFMQRLQAKKETTV